MQRISNIDQQLKIIINKIIAVKVIVFEPWVVDLNNVKQKSLAGK